MWAPQFFSDPAAADRVPDGRSAFSEQLRNLLVPFAFCPEGLRRGLLGYTHQFPAAHFAREESEGGAGREKWKGGKALRQTETKLFLSHKFVASSFPSKMVELRLLLPLASASARNVGRGSQTRFYWMRLRNRSFTFYKEKKTPASAKKEAPRANCRRGHYFNLLISSFAQPSTIRALR